ncbi:hypothetical protein [Roseateles oligotrophus]|uniref:Uncharacterized protein n=1 Tax=Roseateles oligotrophus TaxID=1769250 RepID=A0ABT2YJH8_9BURK|nr:hypothetical protein [Roseateles oligotrophus]MCV2370221.1 hypothetical protein [Roseateles oligotrophus]
MAQKILLTTIEIDAKIPKLKSATVNSMIPNDFPRAPDAGAVSGYQTKLLVRLVDGKYLTGWSEAELMERFDNCTDLVEQLIGYCNRKITEQPGLRLEELLARVRTSAEGKAWDVTCGELDWIMSQLDKRMRSPSTESKPDQK